MSVNGQSPSGRYRCGQLWGGDCQVMVGPPSWSHDEHPSLDAQEIGAVNPDTPLEVLRYLSEIPNSSIRSHVFSNTSCPPDILSRNEPQDQWHRGIIARNPNCPVQALQQIAWDEDPSRRKAVASHPNCPPLILQFLARDKNGPVRLAVAQHPNCPPDELRRFSEETGQHAADEISAAALSHPNCPVDALCRAITPNSSLTKAIEAAVCHPRLPVEWMELLISQEPPLWSQRVAENPSCPPRLLLQLSGHIYDYQVRGAVAKHPHCPAEALRVLSRDPSPFVRYQVIQHPNCPLELLDVMVNDEHPEISAAAANHPDAKPAVRAMWQLAH